MVGTDKLFFMLDLARLRLLLELHEQGTLHAAASTLHVSPSAASQQLSTLAREVGAPLTEADGRKLRLTDAGRVLVEHAYLLLAQLERAEGEVQEAVKGELGQLRVGSFPSMIPSLLIPATRTLRYRLPRLHVDIREVTVPGYLDALFSGDLDVVVAVEAGGVPAAEDARYTRVALGTADLDLALSAGHPAAHRTPVDLSLFERADWVSTIEGDACDQFLHSACASAGFRPLVRHRAGDMMAILALVEADMGVAFVPRSVRASTHEGVVTVAATGHNARQHVYAAVRRGAEARPAVAGYLAALKDTVGTDGCAASAEPHAESRALH